jgi:hypothetical protein
MKKSYAATGGVIALAVLPGVAFAAAELDVAVGAGAEYHDNASQTDDSLPGVKEESDTAVVANASVIFHNRLPTTPIDVDYRIERRDFDDDVQEDETTLTGNSSLVWAALPRRLDFSLTHLASSQTIDRRGPDTAGNREQRSVVTAGANLYSHPGSVDTLRLSPSYTDVQVSGDLAEDSQRATLGAGWEHRLDQVSALTLNLSHSAVETDDDSDFPIPPGQAEPDDEANDYDLDIVSLGLTTRLSRLTYSVEVGGNRVSRDVGDDVSGAMGQLSVEYTSGDYSWGLSYVNQLTDSSIGLETFTQENTNDFQGGDGNVGQFDIVRSSEADIHGTYRFSSAVSLMARVGYLDYDYEDTPRDERDYTAELRYTYIVNSRWQLELGAVYRDADFIEDPNGLQQEENTVDASVLYRFTPNFNTRFTVGREERDVQFDEAPADATVGEGDYVDPYAILMFNYVIY